MWTSFFKSYYIYIITFEVLITVIMVFLYLNDWRKSVRQWLNWSQQLLNIYHTEGLVKRQWYLHCNGKYMLMQLHLWYSYIKIQRQIRRKNLTDLSGLIIM